MNNLLANYISPTTLARMLIDVENLLALDPFDQEAQDFYGELNRILLDLVDYACSNRLLRVTRGQYGR